MKKNIFFVIFALILSAVLAFGVYAARPMTDMEKKDGISAEMELSVDASAPENVSLTVKLKNDGNAQISNVTVTAVLPEQFALASGEPILPVELSAGKSAELTYSVINTLALPETTVEETTETGGGGCGAAVGAGAAVFVLICAVFFVIKYPKRGMSMLLACLMLVPVLVPSAGAATTSRAFGLSAWVEYEGNAYEIGVKVEYDHTFTEAKGTDTKGMEKFEITYYYGPQGQDLCNEDYIKKIAECGFTSIPVEGGDPAINKTALGFVRKYGMTCSGVSDHRIQQAINMAVAGASGAELDAYLAPVVADYAEYKDVIKAWWLRDEPKADLFKALGAVQASLKRLDPDSETMINLFPIYAKDDQLGTNGYQEYLDKFIETVDPSYMSYDHYHFRESGNRKDFFKNLEIFRDTSIKNELDPMLIILLTEHLSYADLTKEQIRWEVNMCLTYGMKRVSYFTFWLCQSLLAQGWSNACMDANGKIYQHYYDVQEINKWLLPLGTELFDKNSTAVFHFGSSSLEAGCEKYTGYGDLGQIKGKSCVIGFFDDGSFMITNKAYNAKSASAVNNIQLLDINDGLEYFDTAAGEWKNAESGGFATRNEDGVLCIELGAGEGMLLRVKD